MGKSFLCFENVQLKNVNMSSINKLLRLHFKVAKNVQEINHFCKKNVSIGFGSLNKKSDGRRFRVSRLFKLVAGARI